VGKNATVRKIKTPKVWRSLTAAPMATFKGKALGTSFGRILPLPFLNEANRIEFNLRKYGLIGIL